MIHFVQRSRQPLPRGARSMGGFTLVEVMVTLIILSVGMLGLAKLQVLAISSTGVSSFRSIAALEASSLAATMRANRDYWSGNASPTFAVAGAVVTDASHVLNAAADCRQPASGNIQCTTSQLAAFDVQQWAAEVSTALPNPTATVNCGAVPVSCSIQLRWTEKEVAVNTNEVAAAQVQLAANAPCNTVDMRQNCYVLYVVP